MTREEFYGERCPALRAARDYLDAMAQDLRARMVAGEDLQPVVYTCSRIKSPESMARKLRERGFPVTPESAVSRVCDAVGLRIVCSFGDDVAAVVQKIEEDPGLDVTEKKDYLARPKPNGYRSVHLCVRLKDLGVPAEIQVRTIAMDFWATLEHQLQYKKTTGHESLIRSELKRCADEIASVDLSMQTLKEIIKEI